MFKRSDANAVNPIAPVVSHNSGFLTNFLVRSKANNITAFLFAILIGGLGTYAILRSNAQSISPTVDFIVSKHQSADSRTISSVAFSTKQPNELLEAFIDSNGPGSTTRQESFQAVTGGGLTWTLRARSNGQNGTAEIWQAVAVNPITNASVTATRATGQYSGDITIVGFLNANTTTNGATATASGRSGAPTLSLTSTQTNSWVWATGFDWDNNKARTVGANQTLNDQYVYKNESITSWTQSQTNPTNTEGAKVTINDIAPISDRWDLAAVEILPAKAVSTPTDTTPPTAPTNLAGNIVNSTQVSLTWTASTDNVGVAKYIVYRAPAGSASYSVVGTATAAAYTDTTTTASQSYSYYVVASDQAGNNSPISNTVTIAVPTSTSSGSGSTGGSSGTTTAGVWWQPPADANWMWEIGTPLVTADANLMGIGVTAYNGDTAPSDNPTIYDIDGIENTAATVAALHAAGDHAICYIEVGTAGNYYTAAQEGIATTYYAQLQAAGDLGGSLSGYPESFININAASAVSIIESMINQQCAQKGFDAVETDLDETFSNNEGSTPFTITQANEEAYLTTLADYMHSIKLGWIAKNLDDTGIASFVSDMEPLSQGIISEQCNQYSSCSLLSPYEKADKWIGNAEYAPETQAEFCASDNAANINGVLFNVNLDGGRQPCR